MSGHIFISYSHDDDVYVAELARHLTAAGLPVWVDSHLDYGDRWGSVIREQVDTCAVFVPIMTTTSEESPWVAREILRAEAKGKPIVPLLLDGDPFFRLADLQYDDVTGGRMPTPQFVERLRGMTGARPAVAPVTRTPARRQPPEAPRMKPSTRPGPEPVTFSAVGPDYSRNASRRVLILASALTAALLGFLITVLIIGFSVLGLLCGLVSAVVLWFIAMTVRLRWLPKPTKVVSLTVGADGLSLRDGASVTAYGWHEFTRVDILYDLYVVAVTGPGSSLAIRADMNGRYEKDYNGFLVCRIRDVGATPFQISQAVALFAPYER